MTGTLAAQVEFGGYIAIWKLALALVGFIGWIPLVNWVYSDAAAVRTNRQTWTMGILIAGMTALTAWLLIPVFAIGLLFYLLSVGAVAIAYVVHRNALVADFERVLTIESFKNMLVDETKKMEKFSCGLTFITGNKNEVPLPSLKSREAEGFIVTCELMDDAIWRRAEQVKFVPQKDEYSVVYLIDGIVTKQPSRTKEEVDAFVYFAKQLGGLDVSEKRKPQQGRFKVYKDKDKDTTTQWQIVTSGSTAGEQIQLDKVSGVVSFKIDGLGFSADQVKTIGALRQMEGGGVIVVSGPPQSGVTTSMYTLLGNHDPFLYSINTLEKSPAAELPNITQNVYTMTDTGTTTYSRRLQTLLRRGPDIMGVEACEDAQSAKLVCAAARDGRVMYVTLEATSVTAAMEKWLKLVGDKALIAETLAAVINQRLIRTLCDECRVPYQPNQTLFKKFNIPANEVDVFYRPGEIEYDKHGKPIVCEKCQGTGFYERTGLFETAVIDEALRKVIKSADSVQDIATAFRKAGMLYMQEQAIRKVMQGMTSINEVIRIFSKKS